MVCKSSPPPNCPPFVRKSSPGAKAKMAENSAFPENRDVARCLALFLKEKKMNLKSPAPFTPIVQLSPPSEFITPLKTGRAKVHFVEKNSPIQAESNTPDFKRVVISSASTASSSSSRSSRKSLSSGYISTGKSTATPFPNLSTQRLNANEVQSLALSMKEMFDDDDDHEEEAQALSIQDSVKETPMAREEEARDETVLNVSDDSNVLPSQHSHVNTIIFDSDLEINNNSVREDIDYKHLLEKIQSSRPSVPLTGIDAYLQSKRRTSSTKQPQDMVNLSKELAKMAFENNIEAAALPLPPRLTFSSTLPPPAPSSSLPSLASNFKPSYNLLLAEELDKPLYKEALQLLEVVCKEHLPKEESPRSVLEKLLLLPVDQIQQKVFQQHDEMVRQGIFQCYSEE